MLRFLLSRFYLFAITEPDKHTVQRAWVSAVGLLLTEFAIQLTNTDVRVTAVVIPDPGQFFLCMGVGMLAVRLM